MFPGAAQRDRYRFARRSESSHDGLQVGQVAGHGCGQPIGRSGSQSPVHRQSSVIHDHADPIRCDPAAVVFDTARLHETHAGRSELCHSGRPPARDQKFCTRDNTG